MLLRTIILINKDTDAMKKGLNKSPVVLNLNWKDQAELRLGAVINIKKKNKTESA